MLRSIQAMQSRIHIIRRSLLLPQVGHTIICVTGYLFYKCFTRGILSYIDTLIPLQ